jgi:hypothetical protein
MHVEFHARAKQSGRPEPRRKARSATFRHYWIAGLPGCGPGAQHNGHPRDGERSVAVNEFDDFVKSDNLNQGDLSFDGGHDTQDPGASSNSSNYTANNNKNRSCRHVAH